MNLITSIKKLICVLFVLYCHSGWSFIPTILVDSTRPLSFEEDLADIIEDIKETNSSTCPEWVSRYGDNTENVFPKAYEELINKKLDLMCQNDASPYRLSIIVLRRNYPLTRDVANRLLRAVNGERETNTNYIHVTLIYNYAEYYYSDGEALKPTQDIKMTYQEAYEKRHGSNFTTHFPSVEKYPYQLIEGIRKETGNEAFDYPKTIRRYRDLQVLCAVSRNSPQSTLVKLNIPNFSSVDQAREPILKSFNDILTAVGWQPYNITEDKNITKTNQWTLLPQSQYTSDLNTSTVDNDIHEVNPKVLFLIADQLYKFLPKKQKVFECYIQKPAPNSSHTIVTIEGVTRFFNYKKEDDLKFKTVKADRSFGCGSLIEVKCYQYTFPQKTKKDITPTNMEVKEEMIEENLEKIAVIAAYQNGIWWEWFSPPVSSTDRGVIKDPNDRIRTLKKVLEVYEAYNGVAVKPKFLYVVDGASLILAPFGLDFIPDLVGFYYSAATGRKLEASLYAVAVGIPIVSGSAANGLNKIRHFGVDAVGNVTPTFKRIGNQETAKLVDELYFDLSTTPISKELKQEIAQNSSYDIAQLEKTIASRPKSCNSYVDANHIYTYHKSPEDGLLIITHRGSKEVVSIVKDVEGKLYKLSDEEFVKIAEDLVKDYNNKIIDIGSQGKAVLKVDITNYITNAKSTVKAATKNTRFDDFLATLKKKKNGERTFDNIISSYANKGSKFTEEEIEILLKDYFNKFDIHHDFEGIEKILLKCDLDFVYAEKMLKIGGVDNLYHYVHVENFSADKLAWVYNTGYSSEKLFTQTSSRSYVEFYYKNFTLEELKTIKPEHINHVPVQTDIPISMFIKQQESTAKLFNQLQKERLLHLMTVSPHQDMVRMERLLSEMASLQGKSLADVGEEMTTLLQNVPTHQRAAFMSAQEFLVSVKQALPSEFVQLKRTGSFAHPTGYEVVAKNATGQEKQLVYVNINDKPNTFHTSAYINEAFGELKTVDNTIQQGNTTAKNTYTFGKDGDGFWRFVDKSTDLAPQRPIGTWVDDQLQLVFKDNELQHIVGQVPDDATLLKFSDEASSISIRGRTYDLPPNSKITYYKVGNEVKAMVPTMCFIEGTPVFLLNQSTPIEKVTKGTLLNGYDEKNKQNIVSKVTRVFKRTTKKLVKIAFGTTIFFATPEHPFYANGHYVNAIELKVGDSVLTQSGEWDYITQVEEKDSTANVYNLEVTNSENTHNYFIGNKGYLVHNYCLGVDLCLMVKLDELVGEKAVAYHNAVKHLAGELTETGSSKLNAFNKAVYDLGDDAERFIDDLVANKTKWAEANLFEDVKTIEAWGISKASNGDELRRVVDNLNVIKGFEGGYPRWKLIYKPDAVIEPVNSWNNKLKALHDIEGELSSQSVYSYYNKIKAGEAIAPIEVYKNKQGFMYVLNGHHRLYAAKLANADIRIVVLNLDEALELYPVYRSEHDIVSLSIHRASNNIEIPELDHVTDRFLK